jgi:hypothetical protein
MLLLKLIFLPFYLTFKIMELSFKAIWLWFKISFKVAMFCCGVGFLVLLVVCLL